MEIFEILPDKLYQSPAIDDYSKVISQGIKVVIDMEGGVDLIDSQLENYLYWPIADADAPQKERLDAVANFGVDCIKNGLKTLSHCAAGINRASLVNGRILMLLQGKTGNEAVDWIRQHRPGALTNQNFVQMLENL